MATTQVKHCLLRSLHPVATQVTTNRPHAVVIYIRRVQGDNLSMLKGCYHDHAAHTADMWCFLCTVLTARTPFHAEINVIEFSSESLQFLERRAAATPTAGARNGPQEQDKQDVSVWGTSCTEWRHQHGKHQSWQEAFVAAAALCGSSGAEELLFAKILSCDRKPECVTGRKFAKFYTLNMN